MEAENLNITRVFSSLKNDFNVSIKDAFNNIKNSKQFQDHSEFLSLEISFEEMSYLTSYRPSAGSRTPSIPWKWTTPAPS